LRFDINAINLNPARTRTALLGIEIAIEIGIEHVGVAAIFDSDFDDLNKGPFPLDQCPSTISGWVMKVSDPEMRIFFVEQGRTRVSGEAYFCTPQPDNPRRTQLNGKKTIYGRTLAKGLTT